MCEAKFTLSWDSFQQNICNGLGALQQNEDLVDMTLAADGHFVKVHQLVLSLASPYFKDLIKSAQCRNPVIFLNGISNTTLSSILEYIYTGQVIVAKENIEELVQAAKALHIRGLMDMSYQVTLTEPSRFTGYTSSLQSGLQETTETKNPLEEQTDDRDYSMEDPFVRDTVSQDNITNQGIKDAAVIQKFTNNATTLNPESLNFQYSVSNAGNLQIILNRFVYNLNYTGKTGIRQWRCTDYSKKKCRASVSTKDNVVLRRMAAHNHPFHDKKIVKKVKTNSIFSVISEAEQQGASMKENKMIDSV